MCSWLSNIDDCGSQLYECKNSPTAAQRMARRAWGPRTSTCAGIVFWAAVLAARASDATSQQSGPWEPTGTFGDVAYLSLNSVVAGLSAGVVSAIGGHDFADAFLQGAIGGAVIYGGKRVAAARFDGAGFVGRQVSAVGVSVVRNAAEGKGMWGRLALPVGPVWIYLKPRESLRPHLRVNMVDAVVLGYSIVRPELEIDWSQTLSAGAPVFVAANRGIVNGSRQVGGVTSAGVIYVDGLEGVRRLSREEILAHERVHVLQHDFIAQVLSAPLEGWLVGRLPARYQRWLEHVDLSLIANAEAWPLKHMREAEADFFQRR
jgi:hypothetical protein